MNEQAQQAMDGSPRRVTRTLTDLEQMGKFAHLRLAYPDQVDPNAEVIAISFQCGPIGEVGVNGCSIEDVLDVLAERLEGFQRGPFACAENDVALAHLGAARRSLLERTTARQAQGVEGTNAPHQSP